MKRIPVASAILLVALAAVAVAAWARAEQRAKSRAAHGDAGEVELRVAGPGSATARLHRAGQVLDDAQPLPLRGASTWLEAGRYFLAADAGARTLLYPIPIDRARFGPESDGSFTVTLRVPSNEAPPPASPRSPQFAFVPSGYFEIGDRNNPGQRHPVWVGGFHLAVFEVTNAEFRLFLSDPRGYDDRANWTDAGWVWKTRGTSQAAARIGPAHPRYARFGADDLPVSLVTWFEAAAYCRWLTRARGEGRWWFRLPTEAEWEKAARGPDSFDYGLGMTLSEPEAPLYNWKKNPDAAVTVVGFQATTSRYRSNRYGIYHLSGNVAEWTQSVFRHYNTAQPYRDDERNDEAEPGMRVTRGGSWYSANTVRLHLAYREEFQPEMSSDDLGFRVAALLGVAPTY